jgi:hypothetical protein
MPEEAPVSGSGSSPDDGRVAARRDVPGEEPPPFARSWGVLYAGVAAILATLIVLFYLFTRAFE